MRCLSTALQLSGSRHVFLIDPTSQHISVQRANLPLVLTLTLSAECGSAHLEQLRGLCGGCRSIFCVVDGDLRNQEGLVRSQLGSRVAMASLNCTERLDDGIPRPSLQLRRNPAHQRQTKWSLLRALRRG